jgi:hypothetical protein
MYNVPWHLILNVVVIEQWVISMNPSTGPTLEFSIVNVKLQLSIFLVYSSERERVQSTWKVSTRAFLK